MSGDLDLDLLTGPEAHGLLAAAVGTAGGELVSWRVGQVDHRPGSRTTASYRARVRWADGEREETLGASTGMVGSRGKPGVLALSDGEREVAVWRFPLDPGLPALTDAWDARTVAALLTSFGVPGIASDGEGVRLRLRAYRPGRRAVIEATTSGAKVFLKVLRPARVADLHHRHVLLHGAGLPVPRSLGWTDDGLLVLEPLRGTPLRTAMLSSGADVPSGGVLLDLLDAMPEAVMELPHRPAWTDGAQHYARVIGAALPSEAARAGQLAAVIADGLDGQAPVEPTHGDFYETQVHLVGGRISGLLDVDTVGPGRRADDLACLLAHTEVLTGIFPEQSERLHAQGTRWLADFGPAVDAAELRLRVAGVLLSLATGPHRVQDPGWEGATSDRLDLVERWVRPAVPG